VLVLDLKTLIVGLLEELCALLVQLLDNGELGQKLEIAAT